MKIRQKKFAEEDKGWSTWGNGNSMQIDRPITRGTQPKHTNPCESIKPLKYSNLFFWKVQGVQVMTENINKMNFQARILNDFVRNSCVYNGLLCLLITRYFGRQRCSSTSVTPVTQDHFYSISATLDHEISIHHTMPCNWTKGQVDEAYGRPLDAIFLCVRFPHSGLGSWWCYHLCRPECKTFWRFPSV